MEDKDTLRKEVKELGVEEDLTSILSKHETEEELAFKMGDKFLSIHMCEDGYDYTFFDRNYHLIDGGVYDDPDVSMKEVIETLCEEENLDTKHIVLVDYEELEEITEEVEYADVKISLDKDKEHTNGMMISEIEENVLCYTQAMIDEEGITDVQIQKVQVYGSRLRGDEDANSDIDILLEYKGDISESSFFNLLHSDEFFIKGMLVDINPITPGKSGTIEEYLERNNSYKKEVIAIMPCEEISIKDMVEYGYTHPVMLPINEESAKKVCNEIEVFRLYKDGSEAVLNENSNNQTLINIKKAVRDGAMLGVEKADWKNLIERKGLEQMKELLNDKQKEISSINDIQSSKEWMNKKTVHREHPAIKKEKDIKKSNTR